MIVDIDVVSESADGALGAAYDVEGVDLRAWTDQPASVC